MTNTIIPLLTRGNLHPCFRASSENMDAYAARFHTNAGILIVHLDRFITQESAWKHKRAQSWLSPPILLDLKENPQHIRSANSLTVRDVRSHGNLSRGSIHLNALKRRAGEKRKAPSPDERGEQMPLTDRFEQVSSAVEQSNRWVHQWALHNLLQPVNPHVAKQCERVNLYTQYQ